jgi:hypothetical protein
LFIKIPRPSIIPSKIPPTTALVAIAPGPCLKLKKIKLKIKKLKKKRVFSKLSGNRIVVPNIFFWK